MTAPLSEIMRTKRRLALWHATRVFQRAGRTGEHSHDAQDAVQRAVVRLLASGKREVEPALFMMAVRREAGNVIRDARPVEMAYVATPGSRRSRATGTFPNQIFGCSLADACSMKEAA